MASQNTSLPTGWSFAEETPGSAPSQTALPTGWSYAESSAPVLTNDQMPGYGGPEAEQAQKNLLMEPMRLGRELAGGVAKVGTDIYYGGKQLANQLGGAAAQVAGYTDQAGIDAETRRIEAERQAALQKQAGILPAQPSLVSKGMSAVIEPAVAKAEAATGDTGFVRSGVEALGDIGMLYGAKTVAPKLASVTEAATTKLIPSARSIEQRALGYTRQLESNVETAFSPKAKELRAAGGPTGYAADAGIILKDIVKRDKEGTLNYEDYFGKERKKPPTSMLDLHELHSKDMINWGKEIGEITNNPTPIPAAEVIDGIKNAQGQIINEIGGGGSALTAAVGRELSDLIKTADAKGGNFTIADIQKGIANNHAEIYPKRGAVVDSTTIKAKLIVNSILKDTLNKYMESLPDAGRLGEIKNMYRAGKTIDPAIERRYIQAVTGLSKKAVIDLYEGGGILALVSRHPLTAATASAISKFNKWARDPNTYLKQAYKAAEKLYNLEKNYPSAFPKTVRPPMAPPPIPTVPPVAPQAPLNIYGSNVSASSPLDFIYK